MIQNLAWEEADLKGQMPLTLKWVDKVKVMPDGSQGVRSRLVVRESKAPKKHSDKLDPASIFSSVPPVEGVKSLLAQWAVQRLGRGGTPLRLAVWDVSRAHFYGKSEREVFVSLPAGFGAETHVGRLLRTMYGTQDASAIWARTWGAA